ncbi:hypothetical protein BVC93_21655 [Mycobacterium sp. MS1601]|nr:hypothetical protein BVC93_21655 [Mycobacterium sp. MS1601]
MKTIAVAAAAAAAVGLAGCGSDSAGEESTAASSASSAAPGSPGSTIPTPQPSAPPATGGSMTLSGYLQTVGITETPARPGEDGAPQIELPMPAGWEQAIDVPGDSFWAIISTTPRDPNNPGIIQAVLSKLSQDISVDTMFTYAAGELQNLPGYQALGQGGRGQLGGVEAYQIGGQFDNNGVTTLIAQKTLLLKSAGGTYVLKVRATGPADDAQALVSATAELDHNTVIMQ